MKRSAISSAAGSQPAANTACTAAAAAVMSRNPHEIAARACGIGNSRNVISVTTPSIPSLPTNSPTRSNPVLFLCVRPPQRTTSPVASTTSNPST